MTRRISSWFVAAVVLCFSLTALAQANPATKIAPRVMAETENGKTTEALVVLAEQADLRPAASLQTKEEKGTFVVSTLREVANRTQPPILRMLDSLGVSYQPFFIVNMIKVNGSRSLMEQLASRNDIAHIDANPLVHTALPQPTGVDSAHVDNIEWNITRVKAPDVWNLGFKGQGLVVAGADTGVQWDHPALKSHYRGWNGQTVDHNYNWHDAVQNSQTPIDQHNHGTFTVSEMVGDDGVGNQVGVAPGAKWIACRNMDSGGNGTPAWYSECFQYLIAPYPYNDPQHGDPTKAPDSINNSWVCPDSEGCSANTLQAIVDAVRAAGIFPAMAAGNDGPGCSSIDKPPAIYASAISVGATDSNNNIAGFSSRGPVKVDLSNRIKPNLSAPGVSVRGAVANPPNTYQSGWSGTSMAAPHLAGSIALMWQAKPSLVGNIDKTQQVLQINTVAGHIQNIVNCGGARLSVRPDNTFGWGLLNILKAVQAP